MSVQAGQLLRQPSPREVRKEARVVPKLLVARREAKLSPSLQQRLLLRKNSTHSRKIPRLMLPPPRP